MNKAKNNHRRAQSNNDFQQIMSSKIVGMSESNSHKNLNKNQSFGNMLFQIPEQTDIGSSTEQSHHSEKKNCLNDYLLSTKKNYSQDQKENLINSNSCTNIISSIQYMIKSGHPIKEIAQKTLNNDSQSKKKHLSFTNELQKKNSQILHQSNKIDISSSLTPDRKKTDNNNSKLNSYKQKSDQQQMDGVEKQKIELSNFLLNNLLKGDQKKKSNMEQQQQQQDSFRRMEFQMNKIQKDISKIKKRQDELDLFNRNIQTQLFDFISESRKYQDYGYQSLQKLEQLEQITRRNEESIKLLKSKLFNNEIQQVTNKQHENNINFGNISSYKQEIDIQKKISDFKYINKQYN